MSKRTPSDPFGFTVSADLVRGLAACAVECGVPRQRLTDLLPDAASGAAAGPARYSSGHAMKLWERIVRASGDPIIGFRMAMFAGPKTFGALGLILPRCATMLEAFRQMARYVGIATQGGHVFVEEGPAALTVSLAADIPPGEIARAIQLWALTNVSLLPQTLTGVLARPSAVTCAFASPGAAAVRSLREHLPFEFGAERTEVRFARSVGDLRIPTADADLHALLAEAMERHLQALGPAASFERGLVAILRGMINGTMPTLAALSAHAGASERTLQRRLMQSGTSFQRLLQRVLNEVADEHLARGDLSHGEIAFLLGYSEESAFSRAYRSWTGRPPSAARLQPSFG